MGLKGDSLIGRSELMRMLGRQIRESASEGVSEKRKREREEKKIDTEWRRKEDLRIKRRKFKTDDKVIYIDSETNKRYRGKIINILPAGRYHFHADNNSIGVYVYARDLRKI